MADKIPANLEKGLRNWMNGNGHDKLMAENELKAKPHSYFSDDILDIWLNGTEKNKERAQRVLEAWGKVE